MANVNRDGGLRLYKQMVDQELELCVIPASDTEVQGIGDAVKVAGDSAQIGNGPYVQSVAQVNAGDAIYGVIEGVLQQSVLGSGLSYSRRHRPASTLMYVLVRPANYQDIYAIVEDGTLAVTDVGENANLTGNGGGTTMTGANTTTGNSTMRLDTSTADTTATLQVKIIGFVDQPTNTPGAANADLLVKLNNIQNGGGTGVAGV